MRMMKKLLMALIVVLTAFTLLFTAAACGKAPKEDAANETAAAQMPNVKAEPANIELAAAESTAAEPINEPAESPEVEKKEILVAYFSATGTTEGVAQTLAEAVGADLFEIVPAEPYTSADLNYNDASSRTQIERGDASARPAIESGVDGMADYDVIFLGYPIWNGIPPRIISTFMESYDFSGKTIVPFCTSGGSGFSNEGLPELTEGAAWREGRRFGGSASEAEIAAWADEYAAESTLCIEIGDTTLTATLADNSSAEVLRELLAAGPLTIQMTDYGSFEKVGELGTTLPRNDESITTEPGDLILYQASRFVIYYDTNTWDFTRLGKIDNITAQELRNILGDGDVTAILSLTD